MAVTVSNSPAGPAAGTDPAGRPAWWRSRTLLLITAWAAAVSNGLIAVTGATVRVTGSGLGCLTWPQCQPGSLIPVSRSGMAAIHQAIEFSNRTLTGVVLITSLATFVLVLLQRPRRSRLLLLAAVAPFGVLLQAVWGGVVVLTGLRWWTVAPHLLASLVILFAALALVRRLYEPDGPARPVVAGPLRALVALMMGVLALLCVAGTLVTAAGPHGGDAATPRLDLPVPALAHLHAGLLYGFLGLLVATAVAFLATGAPRRLLVRCGILIAVTLAQATIGLVQYALGVPEVLVVSHVLGAVLLVTAAAGVWFATTVREPVSPTAAVPVPGEIAARS